MPNRYLAFFTIGFLSVIVFIFFFLRTQPIPEPKREQSSAMLSGQKTPTVTFVNPSRGNQDADVTIVNYADFECVPCKQMEAVLDVIRKTYPEHVRIVWKNMPNESTHPQATNAAVAAHCADRQGKFWEYHDALFERQSFLSDTQFVQIADSLNLDQKKFNTCFTSKDTLPIVKKDLEEGSALGVVATPALFVGDELLIGLQSVEELIQAVEAQLKKHETTK